jgi:hypothetical protein
LDSTQLLAKLRQAAFIGDAAAYPEYPDSKLLSEMSEKLRTDFPTFSVEARAGYLLKTTTVSSTGRARVPSRAFMSGLYTVECLGTDSKYYPLEESAPEDVWRFELQTNAVRPRKYAFEGGDIVLLPTPAASVTLRIRYYIRPSQLTASQNSRNGTDRGRVTNVSGAVVTVNVLPFDQLATVPAAITTGASCDVIRTAGWFEPVAVSQTVGVTGTNITFPSDMTNVVQVGDYLRVEDQSDWPMLPEDFHDLLANDGALAVLSQMKLEDDKLQDKTNGQYQRFRDSLQPRTQQSGMKLKIRNFGSWRR